MEIQNSADQQPEVISKNDDFFDEEPPKQIGDVPEVMTSDEKVKETTSPAPEDNDDKDGGDATSAVDEASGEASAQDQDAVAASGGEEGDGSEPATLQQQEGDEGAEPGAAAKSEEPADEGFQSVSPPPAPEPAPQPAEAAGKEDDYTDGDVDHHSLHDEPAATIDQDSNGPTEPETDQAQDTDKDKDSVMSGGDAKEEEEAGSEVGGHAEGQDHSTPVKGEETTEDKPEAEAQAKDDNDYDDSFSQCSQKSIASIDSTGKTLNPKIETEPEAVDEDNQQGLTNGMTEEYSRSPTPLVAPPRGPSPSPSGASRDSRAEGAGPAVDLPVVCPGDEDRKVDGRSSVEVTENGEFRGEDRTDVSPPEGTEDSRGQGQWKSPEDQYVAMAVAQHKTEQETLKEVQDERDKLTDDHQNLKSSLCAMEEELSKKSDLLVAEREINASRDKQIRELKNEMVALYAKNEEGSEERIKDLQERLAVLARENEEKEQLIHKLNDDLRVTNAKLKETENNLAMSEQERTKLANASEPPKSKTCIIM